MHIEKPIEPFDLNRLRIPQNPRPLKWWEHFVVWYRWRVSDFLNFIHPSTEEVRCCDCGELLSREETQSGRDMCFSCYCWHQD
jgi:hypothetical protein